MSLIYSTNLYNNLRNLYTIVIYFVVWFMFDLLVLLFVSGWLTNDSFEVFAVY